MTHPCLILQRFLYKCKTFLTYNIRFILFISFVNWNSQVWGVCVLAWYNNRTFSTNNTIYEFIWWKTIWIICQFFLKISLHFLLFRIFDILYYLYNLIDFFDNWNSIVLKTKKHNISLISDQKIYLCLSSDRSYLPKFLFTFISNCSQKQTKILFLYW